MSSLVRFRFVALMGAISVLLVLAAPAAGTLTAAASNSAAAKEKAPTDTAVFFAADGLRQDIVAKYASQGLLPTMSSFLKKGTSASGNGLLTQAPPNTGAGWYSLATGAWPGVHGSTNNTFHINGQPFANRTTAFDANVLQAESIAQSAERGGLKVAQVEWAGGRNATIQGPTIDFQSFFSGRGVATNFIGHAGEVLFDDAPFIASFGLQFDHPSGYAGQPAFPAAAPTPAAGWTGSLPATFSPAMEMRLRVLDFGVDKYGLNAWIFDSTNDGTTNYDKVLFSRTKSAADSVGILRKGEWADVKVKIVGGASAGLTAGMLVKVEELTGEPLPCPPLPHLRQPRDRELADVARRAGFHRRLRRVPRADVPDLDGRRLRDPRGRRHLRGDVRRAGPVLEDRPRADARVRRREVRPGPAPRRHADDGRVPAPVPRARLGRSCRTGRPTRRTTTST